MIVATKVRLYPNEEQGVLLEKRFGSTRFVCNYFLEKRDEYCTAHKGAKKSSLSYLGTQNTPIELKKQYPWLYEVSSQSLRILSVQT